MLTQLERFVRMRRKECLLWLLVILIILRLLISDLGDDEEDYLKMMNKSLFDGRSTEDGTWYSQLHPYQFHVYSAFFDNRSTHGSYYNHLRIIVVMEQLPDGCILYCKIYNPRKRNIFAYLHPIGAGVLYQGKYYTEYILTCDLPRRDLPPLSVTITDNNGRLNISHIPVEVPQHADTQKELAVCVSVSYYDLKPHELVEWLEMQKILGVDTVFIYNNSVTGEANKILSAYRDEGFVVLRHSFSFIYGHDEKLIHLHMSPVINDCMYRNMFAYRYFAVIDLDEVIVPRQHMSLPDFIHNLPRILHADRVGSYIFRNAYFFFDLAPQSDETDSYMPVYLKHLRRIPVSPPYYSVKSIVDSQACIAMHNHYCLRYTPDFLFQWTPQINISTKMALLHHYKWCHFDAYLQLPGSCATVMKTSVYDRTMQRFRFRLLKNLNVQLERLGFS